MLVVKVMHWMLMGTVELVSHAGHISKNTEWMDLAAVSKFINEKSPELFTILQTMPVCFFWQSMFLAVKIPGLAGQILCSSLSKTQWTQIQGSQVQIFLWGWKAF